MNLATHYRVQLIGRVQREEQIRQAVDASTVTEDFYDFRNQRTPLPVVRLPLGLPVYRLENCRTFTDQREYLIGQKKAANFFLVGQENESVQQVQHELLAELARTGTDSITPVIDVLKREKQREKLLLTRGGMVVNGNRRLAAMRELYEQDRLAHAEFGHVDCMILPGDVTPDEIIDIEAALQAKQETKLQYDWVGESHLIQRLRDRGRDVPEIAQRLNRKEKEVRNSLLALTEAEIYLREWARAEGEYSRVREDGEQFFKDLAAQLEGKPQPLVEASRVLAWTLYDRRRGLGERLYNFNSTFGKKAPEVLDQLASQLGLAAEAPAPDAKGDSFSLEIESEPSAATYEPVIAALKDPDRRDEAAETLVAICKSVLESERDRKSGLAAEKAIIQAHSRLAEVDLTKADPRTYATIARQLNEILRLANGHLATVARLQANPPRAD